MAIYSKEKFDVLEINVFEEEDLIANHRRKIQEIFGPPTKHRRVDLENLIKYVFLMYDRRTPMVEFFSQVDERKKNCALLAGYEDVNHVRVLEIMSLEDEVAQEFIYKLIKHQKGMVWSALVTNCELFWQYQRELLIPISISKDDKNKLDGMKVKGALAKEVDIILERINGYTDDLFGEDIALIKVLSPTSPEQIADVL